MKEYQHFKYFKTYKAYNAAVMFRTKCRLHFKWSGWNVYSLVQVEQRLTPRKEITRLPEMGWATL